MCCNTNIVLQAGRLGWPVVSQYKRTVLWLEGLQEAKSYRNTKLYCDRGHGRWAGAGRARRWASGRWRAARAGALQAGERARGGVVAARGRRAGALARGALRQGRGARPRYGQAAHDTATRTRPVRTCGPAGPVLVLVHLA